MLVKAYVVTSEESIKWKYKKEDALKIIDELKNDGQNDITFTFSTIEINPIDEKDFFIINNLEVIEL